MVKKKKRPRADGLSAFMRELVLERHANPPAEIDTLRHGMFYHYVPAIDRWGRERFVIDCEHNPKCTPANACYNCSHKQSFAERAYKTMSSVLSAMVIAKETTYRHLRIMEGERQRDEAANPDHRDEFWFEKNGLMPVFKAIKRGLNISLWSCKGFQSTNILEQLTERIVTNPVDRVFIMSDHDSSGREIPKDLQRRLKAMGIDTQVIRIGIDPDDIPEERRALSLKQLNWRDTRTPAFVEEWGRRAYEVEALDARELRQLVVTRLIEHDVDFAHSVRRRHMANQRGMARQIATDLLENIEDAIYQFSLERIREDDARDPTTDELIEGIVMDKPFLEFPEELYGLVRDEAQEKFQTGGGT